MQPMRKNKRKKRKKRNLRTPGDETEDDIQRQPYTKLDMEKGGPGNPTAIPSGLQGVSQYGDMYLAWVKKNCKFARS